MDHLIIDYQMPNLAQARLIRFSNPVLRLSASIRVLISYDLF